eukprot:scaffold84696_cov42-Prasinocladus_malaysianus.AAC.1
MKWNDETLKRNEANCNAQYIAVQCMQRGALQCNVAKQKETNCYGTERNKLSCNIKKRMQ